MELLYKYCIFILVALIFIVLVSIIRKKGKHMKVHGNYYKNTSLGKKKQEFAIEVADGDTLSMREETSQRLAKDDPEFRGLREFFTEENTIMLNSKEEITAERSTIIKIDGCLYYMDFIEEENLFVLGEMVEVEATVEYSVEIIRAKAKELGIKNWHNGTMERLNREIAEKTGVK